MNYYIIEQDKDIGNLPIMNNWFSAFDVRKLHPGTYKEIDDKIMIYVKHDDNLYFPSVLVTPFFMFNEEIKQIYKMYEPNIGYKTIFLVDKENSNYEYYSIPFMDEVDCISEKSEVNQDKSFIKKLVLKKELIPKGAPLFMVKGLTNRCVVARVDFLESILRKDATGFVLREVIVE